MSDLLSELAPLYAAVVADVLDGLGFRNQALPAHIRPLTPAKKVYGRVFTAKAVTVHEIPAEPYKLEIAAVEGMERGDVLVVDAGDDTTCGFWGELLTTACLFKGVRGVVMTACTRDMWKIKDLGFPVFGIGYHPGDSKGRADIVEIRKPITLGGVVTNHGDYILGDEDGTVIIPAAVAVETIRLANEKIAGENIARADLARGVPMGEVFRKYGIL
jgi:4-hydroxy-4-methyl-2-oxoglutarate aldolase